MASGFTLSYGSYSVRLERFTGGGLQRTYVDTATLNFSTTGTAIISGSTRAARKLWNVSVLVSKDDAYDIQDLYEAWDTARASGASAVVGVSDEVSAKLATSPVTANTVFTEPVTLEAAGNDSPNYRVSFGLSEV